MTGGNAFEQDRALKVIDKKRLDQYLPPGYQALSLQGCVSILVGIVYDETDQQPREKQQGGCVGWERGAEEITGVGIDSANLQKSGE
jgi:hypothetical protein